MNQGLKSPIYKDEQARRERLGIGNFNFEKKSKSRVKSPVKTAKPQKKVVKTINSDEVKNYMNLKKKKICKNVKAEGQSKQQSEHQVQKKKSINENLHSLYYRQA